MNSFTSPKAEIQPYDCRAKACHVSGGHELAFKGTIN